MAIVAAKCSGCGAPIEVNDGQREGTCPFCGTRYIAQDIIHNTVNNSYVTNNIGTAIVQGGDTPETLYERFEAFIGLGDLHSAESAAWEMQKKYPQKALTWYCAALYAEELIADGIKRGSERIDSYVARLHFPDAQKILSAQAIEDICSGAFKGLESACPPPESIAFGNVAQALEAAHRFETAEDRSRYGSFIRRVEEGAAASERLRKSFGEYADAARREVEAKTEEWRRSAEEQLGRRKCGNHGGAARQNNAKRRAGSRASRAIGILVAAVIAAALVAGIVLLLF